MERRHVRCSGLKEGGVDWALDQYNEKLITPEMKAKVDAGQGRHHLRQDQGARLHEQQLPVQRAPEVTVAPHAWRGRCRRSRLPASSCRHRQVVRRGARQCAACRWRSTKGAIHGIIGENGAGKSTLMSILYGLYQADTGEIRVDGQAGAACDSPRDAIAHGIGMVHQHFMLVDNFTVLENVVLGAEGGPLLAPGPGGGARGAGAARRATTGSTVDPDALVGDLPVGEQQRVEILKVLYRGADILILDEPTARADAAGDRPAVPHPARRCKAQGKTIILITHKLREIMAVTDRVYGHAPGRDGGRPRAPPRPIPRSWPS